MRKPQIGEVLDELKSESSAQPADALGAMPFPWLANDQLGLLAAPVGTLFVWWGWPLGDPIAAMVVATVIAINALGLFRDNLSFLLGRSPGPEFLARVEVS